MNRIIVKPSKELMERLVSLWTANKKVKIFYKGRVINTTIKRARLIKGVDIIYKPSEVEELQTIMEQLRSPQSGCPWDTEQTHETLLKYLIEEAHEYCDAVASGNDDEILEELGDVLLQVVFHCQIAKEKGNFDLEDCAKKIKDKLIFRHPHIFRNTKAKDSSDVEDIWKKQKNKEKQRTEENTLSGMPPLLRIEKKVNRIKKEYILRKMDQNTYKKIVELTKSEESLKNHLGDLLLNLVIFGNIKDINITFELQKAIQKWEKTV